MIEPEIAELLKLVDNRFTLCSVVSKRAKSLNEQLRNAERSAEKAMDEKHMKAQLEHDKPVPTAVFELYEGKLNYNHASQD